jgi:hypothetical protein
LASLLVAGASLFGCSGTPPGEFIIVQNQVPSDDCSIPATLGGVYRSRGTLDVRLVDGPDAYRLFPVMQNNFPPPSNGNLVDANRIALSGFDVDLSVPADSPSDNPLTGFFNDLVNSADPAMHALVSFGEITSGSVASGSGNTSSKVTVFPGALAQNIRGMGLLSPVNRFIVVATVRARGDTLTGSVESDAFHYPIELCDGCLMIDQGACPVMALAGNSCYPGQDTGTGCCTQDGALFCPSLVAAP